ncbi:MAG: DUF6559 family protein [Alcanivoracaceae bacterium]
MLNYLRSLKRRRAIDGYIRRLGPALLRRYGLADSYTVRQIKATARSLKLDMDYMTDAVALYCRVASPDSVTLYSLDQSALDQRRQELAEAFFAGSIGFTARQVIDLGRPWGWHGGRHENWWANRIGKTGF